MEMVNVNGEIYSQENAKISVFDRGFLFGDSVYEVTRTYGRKIFLWREHFVRMQGSARKIGMELPVSERELLDETFRLLRVCDLDNVYIRWVVTRGEGEIGLDPSLAGRGNFVIFVRSLEENPQWWYYKGVSLMISKVLRNPVAALDPNIKSGNYLNNLLAIKEAREKGFFDAIMLNQQGVITEGTTFNFWVVHGEKVSTPPIESGLLRGITREKLIGLMRENGFDFTEEFLTPQQAYEASECYITSATKELVPVVNLDGHSIGEGVPGSIYKKLHRLFTAWRDNRLEQDKLEY